MVPTQMMITGAVPIAVKFLSRMENLPSVCVVDPQRRSTHSDYPNFTFNPEHALELESHGPYAIFTANPSATSNAIHQSLFCEQPNYEMC